MATVTLTIPDETKEELQKFPWVNWSLVVTTEITGQEKNREAFERFKELTNAQKLKKVKKIVSKSKFTEKDADFLSEKVKKAMHDDLVKEGLI